MTRLFSTLSRGLLVLMGVLVFSAAGAAAQQKILVVDSTRLWNETLAGKDVKRQLDEFVTEVDKPFNQARAGMQQEFKALQEQKDAFIITEEEFNRKVQELAKKNNAFQQQWQKRQAVVNIATRNAQQQFYSAIRPTLLELVDAKKGDLLMEKDQFLFVGDKLNVTDEAMKRIDAKLKELPVTLVQEQAEAEAAEQPAAQ